MERLAQPSLHACHPSAGLYPGRWCSAALPAGCAAFRLGTLRALLASRSRPAHRCVLRQAAMQAALHRNMPGVPYSRPTPASLATGERVSNLAGGARHRRRRPAVTSRRRIRTQRADRTVSLAPRFTSGPARPLVATNANASTCRRGAYVALIDCPPHGAPRVRVGTLSPSPDASAWAWRDAATATLPEHAQHCRLSGQLLDGPIAVISATVCPCAALLQRALELRRWVSVWLLRAMTTTPSFRWLSSPLQWRSRAHASLPVPSWSRP